MNVRSAPRGSEPIDAVVVGAGQAGLAVSYYLRAFGIEHAVLEQDKVGESWRSARWDSFTLVTPNWMTRLPGYLMEAGTGPDFIPRDAIVGVLERLAEGLPVRQETEVLSVSAADTGVPGDHAGAGDLRAGRGDRWRRAARPGNPAAGRQAAPGHPSVPRRPLPQPGEHPGRRSPGGGQPPPGCTWPVIRGCPPEGQASCTASTPTP